jgi:hypothetical protein
MSIDEFKGGIYKITTLHNNKIYIGSSIFLRNRKYNHFSRLKANKHANQHLQRVYNKYGRQNIKFEYLFNCINEDLMELEQLVMDELKPHYNMQKIAGGSALGLKRTKETCEKISNALNGKKLSEEHKRNIVIGRKNYKGKIYQYDLSGNLLKIWDKNIVNIAKDLGFSRSSITDILSKKRNSLFGNVFKYEKEVLNGQ